MKNQVCYGKRKTDQKPEINKFQKNIMSLKCIII